MSGIKQKDFASKIGIVPSTLSDYLNMRITPSQGVIQKWPIFWELKNLILILPIKQTFS